MKRKISIELSCSTETVTAELLEGDVSAYCDQFWAELHQPVRYVTWHTYSTGDCFIALARPSAKAGNVGIQAAPLGEPTLLCDQISGSVMYDGPGSLSFKYGDDVTEPLPCLGPRVATVTDLEAFYRVGREVWDAMTFRHEMVTATLTRKEEE